MYHAVTDFTNQNAVIGQIIRRASQNAARQLQTVCTGCQAEFGFVTIFIRQIGHIFRIHIRRIGHDQIVLQFWQIAEQIGADRRHMMN
ncbi:hypothetical protein D3C87_1929250 [compost metagenome]